MMHIQQAENIRITESDTSINSKYLLLKEVSDSIITLCQLRKAEIEEQRVCWNRTNLDSFADYFQSI